ncbi:cytochrome P450 [Infundibulicybe gibba]|nr:cytochrome P450 [Infundibulicybe gibba]
MDTVTTVGAASVLLLCIYTFAPHSTSGSREIKGLGGFPILTAWPFFTRRFDFLRSHFNSTKERIFRFSILHHSVVALNGEEGRKLFFDDKNLNSIEGYKVLMGAAPRLQDISLQDDGSGDVQWFNKQLSILLHRNRLADVVPSLFEEMNTRMTQWGKSGRIDPFDNIYELVFSMTLRMATSREATCDANVVRRLMHMYQVLQESATPTALLLPWLPSRAKRDKAMATQELYVMISGFVQQRRDDKVPSSDAIDVLLEQGLDDNMIMGFIMSVIFAGVLNTGINACWLLIYLESNPEWKSKVTDELKALISKNSGSPNDPLFKQLGMVPIAAWEEETPQLEYVLRETIRLVINGTALRRNLTQEMSLYGKDIHRGDFLAYQLADAHLDPEIYSKPDTFDPTRFFPDRAEDKKGTFAYLGWGAGRHPCSGMKVAKLEMKMVAALFLLAYDYKMVDASGLPFKTAPRPDYNNIHQARPCGATPYFQFTRKAD